MFCYELNAIIESIYQFIIINNLKLMKEKKEQDVTKLLISFKE